MAEDISHYKRVKLLPDRSEYSFGYLFEAAHRYLLMKREDAMQDALSQGLMGTTDRAAPGIPNDHREKGTATDPDVSQENDPNILLQEVGKPISGKGEPKGKSACFAYQTGTCARGRDCGYAHIKDNGALGTPGERCYSTNTVYVFLHGELQVLKRVHGLTRTPALEKGRKATSQNRRERKR